MRKEIKTMEDAYDWLMLNYKDKPYNIFYDAYDVDIILQHIDDPNKIIHIVSLDEFHKLISSSVV